MNWKLQKKAVSAALCLLALCAMTLCLSSCSAIIKNIINGSGVSRKDPPLTRTDEVRWLTPPETEKNAAGDGTGEQFGGNWPDNEFTRLVPRPPFDILTSTSDDDSFSAVFRSADTDTLSAYADSLRQAGFNVDESSNSQEMFGISIFSFSASDSGGYSVSLYYTSGSGAITISK